MEKLTREECANLLEILIDMQYQLTEIRWSYLTMRKSEGDKWNKKVIQSDIAIRANQIAVNHYIKSISNIIKENSFAKENNNPFIYLELFNSFIYEYSSLDSINEKREYLINWIEDIDTIEVEEYFDFLI